MSAFNTYMQRTSNKKQKRIIDMNKKDNERHIYSVELTKRQVEILSQACDRMARLIEGQDFIYQDLMEEAWEKRCKEATGEMMNKEFEGGWRDMRADAEEICKQIKRRFWGLDGNTLNGVNYDDTADILFDIHQVLRHQLWLDRPEDKKSPITVDASEAMRFGSSVLAKINRINNNK